jgi:hypothetical protein
MSTTGIFQRAYDCDPKDMPIRWVAIKSVEFPEGTIRHPGVLDLVKRELGQKCTIDNRDEGLRLAFSMRMESEDRAREHSAAVGIRLLELLGADQGQLIEDVIYDETVFDPKDREPPLKLVRP